MLCEVTEKFMEAGRQAGLREGRQAGETRFAGLTRVLMEKKRLDDLNRAVSDEKYREQLYEEFGL